MFFYSPLLPPTYVPSKAKHGWGTRRERERVWYSIFRAVRSDNAYMSSMCTARKNRNKFRPPGRKSRSQTVNAERGERPTIIAVTCHRIALVKYPTLRSRSLGAILPLSYTDRARLLRAYRFYHSQRMRRFIYKERFAKYCIADFFSSGIVPFNNSAR